MEKIMCDICEKNEATKKYKCKKREKCGTGKGGAIGSSWTYARIAQKKYLG